MSVDKFYITYRTDSLYNVNMDCAMFLFTYQLLNRTHNYHVLNKRGKTRIMFCLYCLILHPHFFWHYCHPSTFMPLTMQNQPYRRLIFKRFSLSWQAKRGFLKVNSWDCYISLNDHRLDPKFTVYIKYLKKVRCTDILDRE